MIARFARRLAPVALAAAVVAAASGCSSTMNDAATVEYTDAHGSHTAHLTRSDFDNQLADLIANPKFRELAAKSHLAISGDSKNTTSSDLANFYMSEVVNQVPVDALFQERGLQVTADLRTTAEKEVRQRFGTDVVDAWPKDFTKLLIDRQARLDALKQSYANPTPDDVRAFYDQYKEDICPSGRIVSHILVKDAAKAKTLLAQLPTTLHGAELTQKFGELALKNSTDTGSAKAGGLLGCIAKGQAVPEFERAAFAAPFDHVVGPVQTQFGYHLILVQAPTSENTGDLIAQSLQQGGALRQLATTMHVRVDPRYGTWKTGTGLEPVTAPNPASNRQGEVPTTTTVPSFG